MRYFILALLLIQGIAHAERAPDFSILDALLKKNVSAAGRVDYAAWKANDEPRLDSWLALAATAKPDEFPSRSDRLAFWINAYNAGTLKRVLAHWPVTDVTKIPDFFTAKELRLAGKAMSLNDIEHGVIRKIFSDPRVHATLVCAGTSCPRLKPGAFSGAQLDTELDESMKGFLADSTKNRFDPRTNTAYLSEIFKWYAEDFKLASGSLIAYIKPFAPAAAQEMLARPDVKIEYLKYDFGLNGK